jgi:prepilin-type N-terminal cleavage/methylation domain-containing protein
MFKRIDKKIQMNKGMSYVELIVVLSIFSVLSSIAIFNYGTFQDKVDIKNLASDVALKIVEAQRSSLSGLFPPLAQPQNPATWKPSYGIYFDMSENNNNSFIYFTDLDYSTPPQNGFFDDSDCVGECLDKIVITKGNSIFGLDVFYKGGATDSLSDLTITFSRPNSGAIISSSGISDPSVSYVQITVVSPSESKALIKVYPSGRVQIN